VNRSELSRLRMHVLEAVGATESFDVVGRLMVARNHKYFFSPLPQDFSRIVKATSPRDQIPDAEVIICFPIDQPLEGFEVGMDVGKKQESHRSDFIVSILRAVSKP